MSGAARQKALLQEGSPPSEENQAGGLQGLRVLRGASWDASLSSRVGLCKELEQEDDEAEANLGFLSLMAFDGCWPAAACGDCETATATFRTPRRRRMMIARMTIVLELRSLLAWPRFKQHH